MWVKMSLPEWTFGEAELSSHGDTRRTRRDSRCTPIISRLTANDVAQVAAGREVLLGKQDLLCCCSTAVRCQPEFTGVMRVVLPGLICVKLYVLS